ncbi:DUF3574 domain-containing protein [Labilibacter marinus]|uniref:DUF3574 domain-containing protein n=1 Tax=Labilibacter marinus TaxID=1477105 RepID=UPI000831C15E|nr:DUF3574 domain-containing protein [Labilibacter marinus]
MIKKKTWARIKNKLLIGVAILPLLISSCTQHQHIQTDLYFGLSTKTDEITPDQWNSFKTQTLDEALSGYTQVDAQGYWQSASGEKYRENSKLIIYIHEDSSAEFNKLDSIIHIYKTQFNQESVLEVHHKIIRDYSE